LRILDQLVVDPNGRSFHGCLHDDHDARIDIDDRQRG
jgi:hypothetical protein